MTKQHVSNYVTCHLEVSRVRQEIIYSNVVHLVYGEGLEEVEEYSQKVTCKILFTEVQKSVFRILENKNWCVVVLLFHSRNTFYVIFMSFLCFILKIYLFAFFEESTYSCWNEVRKIIFTFCFQKPLSRFF